MIVELVRHGRTLLQEEHRYVGSTDDELSPAGRAELTVAPTCPSHVYVTPLQRTAQTAEVVFPEAGLVVVAGLEEMDFGMFEGRSHAELEHDEAYCAWLASNCLDPCPQGEDKEGLCERVCIAFAYLMDDAIAQGEDSLTLVAHGGTIMAVMERFGQPRRAFFDWRVAHGHGLLLDAGAWAARHELKLVGETCHVRASCVRT